MTYTPPRQPYWGGRQVRGGWFVGNEGLLWTLEDIGLPSTPPSDGGTGFTWWLAAIALGAGLALVIAARLGLKRRREMAPAH
jgi:hypothetical protein